MTTQLPNIINGQLALTDVELAYLETMVLSGNRAGFYLTYGSMIAYREDNGSGERAYPVDADTHQI